MSALGAAAPGATLLALIPGTLRTIWHDLPTVMLACLVWSLSAAPLVVALAARAPWWMTAGAVLPAVLAGTGMAAVADDLRLGERVRLRRLASVDPVLAFLTWLAVLAPAALVATDGWAAVLGYALAGVLVLVLPTAFAYGALRGHAGPSALRGGLFLAIRQPGVSLSLAGLGVLLAFTVVATAGALALVVPAVLALLTAKSVAASLS